jgi:tRNA nucleotidyltransferase (CCA-adding enzyme)
MAIKIYKVGGCIRDKFLGLPIHDIDYCVEAPSFDAMRDYIVNERGGKIYLETPQHFTIRARVPSIGDEDFVLCRKDGAYSDGRRPDTVEVGTLAEDLARRDFTVNAMAEDEDGVLYDPYDGQRACAFRLLECVGNAKDRLTEDSLRMLRAIRFAITKNFVISPEIEACLSSNDMLKLLDNISVERIREELVKCFQYDTYKSLHMFTNTYSGLGAKIFQTNKLWLKPTINAA